MYALFVTVNIKDGYADEFAKASLGDGQGSVRDEENCFRFDILRNPDNPNQFYLYEVYTDRAGHAPTASSLITPPGAPQWSTCSTATWAASRWKLSSLPTPAGRLKNPA